MKKVVLIFIVILYWGHSFAQVTAKTDITHIPELSTFIKAMNTAAMHDTLNAKPPLTIFAPDNHAFEKLQPRTLDSLLDPVNRTRLIALLNRHIIHGKITSKDIARQIHMGNGQATFTTLYGNTITAKINANRNIVLTDDMGNESIIKRFDIKQGNISIFIMDSVLTQKY